MKIISLIIASILALIVMVGSIVVQEMTSVCGTLTNISKNQKVLDGLFTKLSFYIEDPTYLSKYPGIDHFPSLVTKRFSDIDYGLEIDWVSLGLEPSRATFSYQGKTNLTSIDYKNIDASQVKRIIIGLGERHRLIFELQMNDSFDENVNQQHIYDVNVECFN